MSKFLWGDARQMPWKQRNALLESTIRELLAERSCDLPGLTSKELAALVDPSADETMLTVITKLAKWLPLATQDGREFYAYGRKMRGYTWKGQKVFT